MTPTTASGAPIALVLVSTTAANFFARESSPVDTAKADEAEGNVAIGRQVIHFPYLFSRAKFDEVVAMANCLNVKEDTVQRERGNTMTKASWLAESEWCWYKWSTSVSTLSATSTAR